MPQAIDETRRPLQQKRIAGEVTAGPVVDGTDALGIFAFLMGVATFSATVSNES